MPKKISLCKKKAKTKYKKKIDVPCPTSKESEEPGKPESEKSPTLIPDGDHHTSSRKFVKSLDGGKFFPTSYL